MRGFVEPLKIKSVHGLLTQPSYTSARDVKPISPGTESGRNTSTLLNVIYSLRGSWGRGSLFIALPEILIHTRAFSEPCLEDHAATKRDAPA